MNKFIKFGFIIPITLFCLSCSSNTTTIIGKFAGIKNQTIILEEMFSNNVVFIDSVETNSNGEFKLKYKNKDNLPAFLRVRYKNDFIILIAKPSEVIELNSMLNLSNNYLVSGSKESELIKELNSTLTKSYDNISALYNEYNKTENEIDREKLSYAISELYIKQKQENIKFIINNSKSLASVIALHQVMPNGVAIFGDHKDLQYFKLVSDSLNTVYPNSSFVKALNGKVKEFENRQNVNKLINETVINNITTGHPDILLNDIAGNPRKLSDLKGKIIILSFWASTQGGGSLLNKEMKDLYSELHEKGLEIYQVSFDQNKAYWINEVKNQGIPWISVHDSQALNSPLIKTFSLQYIPANFIIDRNGDIVAKNIAGNDLVKKITSLF